MKNKEFDIPANTRKREKRKEGKEEHKKKERKNLRTQMFVRLLYKFKVI